MINWMTAMHPTTQEACTLAYIDLDNFIYDNDQMGHSIGAITYTQTAKTVDDMLREADGLMYQVKKQGKDRLLYQG